jgi:4-carboxymuconolactone decarboxylase
VSPDGTLVGPFNAFLHSPSIGRAAAALGEAVRFDATFDRGTIELITVVVAVHWRADFEYWAHRRAAIESGVPVELIDAVAAGRPITSAVRADEVVVTATRELLTTGRLNDDTYSCALELLRPAGIVDLVTLVGYYTLVSLTLNAFEVSAPVPSSELWPD